MKREDEGTRTLAGKKRILEVSDSEGQRAYNAAICERQGFDVIQARCGHEAYRLYRKYRPFALVLTDLYFYDSIPEPSLKKTNTIRDGIRFALAIRKLAPEQKIVIHTGASGLREILPKDLADVPVLVKPYRISELQSLLEPS